MRGSSQRWLSAGLCLLVVWQSGCAAFHPMDGVPARYLPNELKVGGRTDKRTIDLSLLRQTPPPAHLIDSGDVLAIYVEGFVGRSSDPPPVFFPQNNEFPPSFGLPFPVRDDGTISLPRVGSISLRGLTIPQAEERVRQCYLTPRELINPENHRVQVSLQRPRQYRVLVIRQDSRNEPIPTGAGMLNIGMVKRGTGKVVSLPAYSNDVLNALTATDGLPGLDAENAVYVIRRRGPRRGGTLDPQWPLDFDPSRWLQQGTKPSGPVIRGQSPYRESRYLHSPQLAGSTELETSTGSLHAPVWNTSPAPTPVGWSPSPQQFAEMSYGAPRGAAYGPDVDTSPRPRALPGYSITGETSTGIVPASAGNNAPPSGPYGYSVDPNGIAQQQGTYQAVAQQPSWHDSSTQYRAAMLYAGGAWSTGPTPIGEIPAGRPAVTTPEPSQVTPPTFLQGGPQWSGQPTPAATPQMPLSPTMAPTPPLMPQPMAPGSMLPPGHTPVLPQIAPMDAGHGQLDGLGLDGRHVIRIPIRLGPGETADMREEDIILQDGDIVFIESRDTEVFYTGGLLGGGQYTLPRDYDLDILQALSLAQSRNGGGGAGRQVGGVSALNNDVSVSPSTVIVLRKLPDGGEVPIKVDLYRARTDLSERIVVQPGDYLLLQYTPLEAVVAFFERHLLESALFGLAAQNFSQNGN